MAVSLRHFFSFVKLFQLVSVLNLCCPLAPCCQLEGRTLLCWWQVIFSKSCYCICLLMVFGFVACSGWASASQCVQVSGISRTLYTTLPFWRRRREIEVWKGCKFVKFFFETELCQLSFFVVFLTVSLFVYLFICWSYCQIFLIKGVHIVSRVKAKWSARDSVVSAWGYSGGWCFSSSLYLMLKCCSNVQEPTTRE